MKEEIIIPIYFFTRGKKIVIDVEGITKEFNKKLAAVVENPEKYLEV